MMAAEEAAMDAIAAANADVANADAAATAANSELGCADLDAEGPSAADDATDRAR